MKIIKVVLGLVLIAVGVGAFIVLDGALLKYGVGIVALIAGIALLVLGFIGGGVAPVEGGNALPVKKEVVAPVKV